MCDTHAHRMQSPVGQVDVVGRSRLTEPHGCTVDGGPDALVADDDAHEQVGVACDVLGGRVHDHVDAMVERLEIERRRPGVVDDARHAVPAAGGDAGHVRHFERVRTRILHHEERRLGPHHGLDRLGRGCGIEELDVNAHRAQDLLGEFARGSVDRVRKERMTARPHERKERRRRGGQARRKGPCARGVRALERLHRRIERLVCRTAVAPVAGLAVPAGHLVMDAVHHVLAGRVKHRRGAHHGRIDVPPLRVPVAARVHELRCGIKILHRHGLSSFFECMTKRRSKPELRRRHPPSGGMRSHILARLNPREPRAALRASAALSPRWARPPMRRPGSPGTCRTSGGPRRSRRPSRAACRGSP